MSKIAVGGALARARREAAAYTYLVDNVAEGVVDLLEVLVGHRAAVGDAQEDRHERLVRDGQELDHAVGDDAGAGLGGTGGGEVVESSEDDGGQRHTLWQYTMPSGRSMWWPLSRRSLRRWIILLHARYLSEARVVSS